MSDESSPEAFGFTVARIDVKRWPYDSPSDPWRVSLPHQCDNWDVAYGGYDQAVTDLRQFIAEAQAALAALTERREIGDLEDY